MWGGKRVCGRLFVKNCLDTDGYCALWRRGWDSNPRYPVKGTTVFETAPFGHSGTPPKCCFAALRPQEMRTLMRSRRADNLPDSHWLGEATCRRRASAAALGEGFDLGAPEPTHPAQFQPHPADPRRWSQRRRRSASCRPPRATACHRNVGRRDRHPFAAGKTTRASSAPQRAEASTSPSASSNTKRRSNL
jgi:hypothetical protein